MVRIDRRSLLKHGLLGTIASSIAAPRRGFSAEPKRRGKSCIVLWMNGGPSHIDTWDPKPGAPTGGPTKAIKTRVPELEISEHLPALAEQAHQLAVIRSMTSKEGNHERAQALGRTGYSPNPTAAFPSLGAWVSAELGDPSAELPAFVSVSGPSTGPGFLGIQHGPFVVPNPSLPPENTSFPRNVDFVRFVRRRAALDAVEKEFYEATHDPKVKSRQELRSQAIRMMFSSRLRAFELKDEPEAVKKAYGDTDFGRGCLLARRLIEAGTRFVEVSLDGWDTHADNFGRTKKLMSALDPAMSSLLRELNERELLGQTLVVWMGDFGRTARINANDGRDHQPQAWTAVLAGGGVRGGVIHGRTDAEGAKVAEKPVSVANLFATIATVLGMDPDKTIDTPEGRPISLTDSGKPIAELLSA
jgi:hypothetical protein